MRKTRVKKFWFQVVAIEKQFSDDVYQYGLCFKTISQNYAIRSFWLRFSGTGENGRIRGIEITAVTQVKKEQPPFIKRLVDAEYSDCVNSSSLSPIEGTSAAQNSSGP